MDIQRARRLRREMSKAECVLWKKLREFPPELGLTFRRQHPIHPYILDFACIKIKLAVELDGPSHDTNKAQQSDYRRTTCLSQKGYTILRFTNDECMSNANTVAATILHVASRLKKALPPWGEG